MSCATLNFFNMGRGVGLGFGWGGMLTFICTRARNVSQWYVGEGVCWYACLYIYVYTYKHVWCMFMLLSVCISIHIPRVQTSRFPAYTDKSPSACTDETLTVQKPTCFRNHGAVFNQMMEHVWDGSIIKWGVLGEVMRKSDDVQPSDDPVAVNQALRKRVGGRTMD